MQNVLKINILFLDSSRGKSKTSRWFEPPEEENHEQEITAEWEAWLRGRR